MQPSVDLIEVKVIDTESGRELSKPISLSVSAGELCIFVGPNGVGKSTLLNGMAELLTSKASTFPRLRGQIRPRNGHVTVRLHPQISAPMFALPLSLSDVLTWYQLPSHFGSSPLVSGLDLSRPWDSASGGEKQRVLLAGILAKSPPEFDQMDSAEQLEILMLDEPGNHLDAENHEVLRVEIRKWMKEAIHRAVVIVTHDPQSWSPCKVVKIEPVALVKSV